MAVSNLLVTLLLLLSSLDWSDGAECPSEDSYSPCVCTRGNDDSVNVACVGLTNSQIRSVFEDAPPIPINRFDLVPVVERLLRIEADLLGDKKARFINIANCPSPTLVASSLLIDADAFSASRDYTTSFSIIGCPLATLNWSFLDGFNQLSEISLESSTDIQSISSLPIVQNVEQVSITGCTGLEQSPVNFPGTSLPNLKRLVLNTDLKIEQTEEILESLVSTAVGLEQLTLTQSSSIEQVPRSILKFSNLLTIELSFNSIREVGVEAFNFVPNSVVRLIDLAGNTLETIVETAFNPGDYGKAVIRLDDNDLRDFKFEVFLQVLQEMEAAGGGEISLTNNNNIQCGSCKLAWLVRDNRQLLPFVTGGFCSDLGNKPFSDVDPTIYGTECTSLTTTTTTTTTESTTSSTESTTVSTESTTVSTESTTVSTESTTASTESTTPTSTTTESTTPKESTSTASNVDTTKIPIESTTEDGQNNQDDVKTLLYVTLGLIGLVLLILLIGFVYFLTTRKARRKRINSVISDQISIANKRSAPPDTRANSAMMRGNTGQAPVQPYAGQKMAQKYPSQAPTQAEIPRPGLIVQGPGGKYYIQANPPESLSAADLARQSNMDRSSMQSGLRRSYY